MLQFEYARSALKNGLKLEQAAWRQPVQVRHDRLDRPHTSLATAEEDNFFGKHSGDEPSPGAPSHPFAAVLGRQGAIMGWEMAASGYAAVWATENTREAIFDAMKRKEVYATTGPRMMVRFFGGWDFRAWRRHDAQSGGGRLRQGRADGRRSSAAPAGKAPTFLVAALKDPIGANLDRFQIVKGWLDADGALQEKVYDVVWSDAATRKPGADGKLPPVGNTVDVPNATWTNTIGAPELITVWNDPDFDPSAARLLLRPRDRDPDAALDRLRRQVLRRHHAEGGADDHAGAGLHLADLVHAEGLTCASGAPAAARTAAALPAAGGTHLRSPGRGGGRKTAARSWCRRPTSAALAQALPQPGSGRPRPRNSSPRSTTTSERKFSTGLASTSV